MSFTKDSQYGKGGRLGSQEKMEGEGGGLVWGDSPSENREW